MTNFNVHTIEAASDASKPLLEDSKKAYGFVPNLHAVMAESPALLEAGVAKRWLNPPFFLDTA